MDASLVSPLIWLLAAQLALYSVGWGVCSLMVPEERAAALNWGAFAVLVGAGMVLAATRTEPRSWWAYCGSNLFTVLSFLAVLRGGAEFTRAPTRNVEHLLTVLLVVGVLVALGEGAGNASWRVLFVYLASSAVLVRALFTLFGPIRAEFGTPIAVAVLPPVILVVLMFMLRAFEQASNLETPLEIQRHTAGGVPMLFGYLVGSALFHFGFLSLLIMRLVRRLRELSQRDPLTDLLNRRAMNVDLEREWQRYKRNGTTFAVLAIDIDHFKRVNDQHGHAGGDTVLVRVAQQLRASARLVDQVARVGGEEFLLLMNEVDAAGAVEAAQRLRQAVAGASVALSSGTVAVTVSVGVALPHADDAGPAAMLKRADEALYRAKATGRNRVCMEEAGPEDAASAPAEVSPPPQG